MTALRDEIRRLRQELLGGTRHGLEEKLTSIAQQVADIAAASAHLRERQAGVRAAGEARPSGADAADAGARALRDLAADPSQIGVVRGWLRPGHFAQAEHGELYAVMLDMTAAGQPVDPVTVSWEASRRGIEADAADLADGMGTLAVASAWEVHRHGLLAQVARAGRDIQASADDDGSGTGPLLRSASDRLRRLDRDRYPRECHPRDQQSYSRQPTAEPAAEAEAGAA
jgi:hypothetical protein